VADRKHKVLTFEEWFANQFMRLKHLDTKSQMAWAWTAGIEQAAHELDDPKLKGFEQGDQIRDLKCYFDDLCLVHGGRRSDMARRFIIVRGPGSLKDLVKLAKMMVPSGTIWRPDELPPGAQIAEAPSNALVAAEKEKGPFVIVEIPDPRIGSTNIWADAAAEEKARAADFKPFTRGVLMDILSQAERTSYFGKEDPLTGLPAGEVYRIGEPKFYGTMTIRDKNAVFDKCSRCHGSGTLQAPPEGSLSDPLPPPEVCPTCSGAGFIEKMMPRQNPYTDAERAQRDALTAAAGEAEVLFTADELEEHTRKQHAEKGWDIFNDPMVDRRGDVWFEVERDDEAALYTDDEEPAREHFHQVLVDNRVWAREPKTETAKSKVAAYLAALEADLKKRQELEADYGQASQKRDRQTFIDPQYRVGGTATPMSEPNAQSWPPADIHSIEGEPAKAGTAPDAQERLYKVLKALDTEEGRARVGEELHAALREQMAKAREERRRPVRALAEKKGIPVFDDLSAAARAISGELPLAELRFLDRSPASTPEERALMHVQLQKFAAEHGFKIELFGPKESLRMEHIPIEVRKWILENCAERLERTSGDVICAECDCPYSEHPEIALTQVLLCDGRIGKL
jgi:hypothetical protein